MPKRRMTPRTAAQRAASRRNLVKARAARNRLVTVYRHTDPKSARKILQQQSLRGNTDFTRKPIVYFTNMRHGSTSKSFGDSVVKLRVAKKFLHQDPETRGHTVGWSKGEKWYYVLGRNIKGHKIRRAR